MCGHVLRHWWRLVCPWCTRCGRWLLLFHRVRTMFAERCLMIVTAWTTQMFLTAAGTSTLVISASYYASAYSKSRAIPIGDDVRIAMLGMSARWLVARSA